jgi:hypothetical protein
MFWMNVASESNSIMLVYDVEFIYVLAGFLSSCRNDYRESSTKVSSSSPSHSLGFVSDI